MHWVMDTVQHYLLAWGYWAIVLGLLGENAGLPLPGETILVFASFLAFKHHYLHIPLIILAGTLAAALGDNLGYWSGRKLGRRFLASFKRWFHVDEQDIALGQDLIQRKGRQTIFAARFLLGLRILAGPLAGTLKMEWKRFAFFNFLGAATWVTVIVLIGYASAHKFDTLLEFFEKADLALTVAVAAVGLYCWHRYKRRRQARIVLSVERLPAGHRHSSLS